MYFIFSTAKKQQHTTLPSFTQKEITDDDYINDVLYTYMIIIYKFILQCTYVYSISREIIAVETVKTS